MIPEKYAQGLKALEILLTPEEITFARNLTDGQIAAEKFEQTEIAVKQTNIKDIYDIGVPITVRIMLARSQRPEVQNYLIIRYFLNDDIRDEDGPNCLAGEIKRWNGSHCSDTPINLLAAFSEWCRHYKIPEKHALLLEQRLKDGEYTGRA